VPRERGEAASQPQSIDNLFSKRSKCPPRGASALPAEIFLIFWRKEFFCFLFFYFTIFLFSYFQIWDSVFEMTHEPSSLEEGTLAEDGLDLPCLWQKGGGETSGIGRGALRVVDYVDSSMWYVPLWILIMSSIITNRASDRYSEHSKREYYEPHKDSWDWQDWGLTLEAIPQRGGGSAGCPKKDKRRARGESRDQNTQIGLNK